MDRDTIRLIVLAAGVVILAGIYIWGRYKQKLLDFLQRRREFEELGLEPPGKRPEPPRTEDDELFDSLSYKGRKEGGTVRKEPSFSGTAFDEEEDEFTAIAPEPPKREPEPEPEESTAGNLGAPFLIQISVVAGRGRAFDGLELRDALLYQDLIHGEMGIFHRYDRQFRHPLFSIASLVEPGTFPMDDMENFECPGIVLFFQTARVADPLGVYDDLVNTSQELAKRLDGIVWDENRQPLSAEKINHMRTLLEDAVEQP